MAGARPPSVRGGRHRRAARARELAILLVAAIEGGFLLSRAAKSTEAMHVLGHAVADSVQAALPA